MEQQFLPSFQQQKDDHASGIQLSFSVLVKKSCALLAG